MDLRCYKILILYAEAVLDYHLHLWPHGMADHEPSLDELAKYCEIAATKGITEIALTEHLFRFSQAEATLGQFFRKYPDSEMRILMQEYWNDHAKADLDVYVQTVLRAKEAGLPVVLGLEVDYYEGEMDRVADLLRGYPFDVLLGSVHWIETWPFDHISDPIISAEWESVGVEPAWEAYTRSLEELSACGTIDVLAHPDLIKIAGHRPEVPDEYYHRMAEAAAKSKIAAELSTAGWRKPVAESYPGPSLLAMFHQLEVPITTASDSHGTTHIGYEARAATDLAVSAGYRTVTRFRERLPSAVAIKGD